jgi:hypothetical protein
VVDANGGVTFVQSTIIEIHGKTTMLITQSFGKNVNIVRIAMMNVGQIQVPVVAHMYASVNI